MAHDSFLPHPGTSRRENLEFFYRKPNIDATQEEQLPTTSTLRYAMLHERFGAYLSDLNPCLAGSLAG